MRRLVLLGLLAVSCQQQTPSALKHDADNPVIDGQGLFWTEQDDADYFGGTQKINVPPFDYRSQPAAGLPAEHPLVKRLQSWVDLLDGKLRQKYPGLLDQVPVPRIKVLNVSNVNAYVAPMPICYDNVAVRILKDTAFKLSTTEVASYQQGAIINGVDAVGRIVCKHTQATASQIVAWLAHSNNRDRQCKLALTRLGDNRFEVHPGAGCPIDPALAAGTSALLVTPTAQTVTVYAGITRLLTEEQMIAVLYHELGHYYHGHAVAAGGGAFGYLYHLDKGPAGRSASELLLPRPQQRPRDPGARLSDRSKLSGQRLDAELG